MKFLADMPMSKSTVAFLKNKGHDVHHLIDLGLEREKDSSILELAREEQRVVLTMDLDFGDILAAGHFQFPSVIIFRLQDNRPSVVNQLLDDYLDGIEEDLGSGAVVIFEATRIRVRRLPIL